LGTTNGKQDNWNLVSSHGAVLFYIAARPGCTVQDISTALSVTTRTVWSRVGDLRRAGMVSHRRQGRRYTYTVELDAPFFHPSIKGLKLGMVLGSLVQEQGGTERPSTALPAPGSA
jgi:hypothetical protein